MKGFLIFGLILVLASCGKRPESPAIVDQARLISAGLTVPETNGETSIVIQSGGFSQQNKLVLTATNLAAVEAVLDWALRDRLEGKMIYPATNQGRSSLLFPDGVELQLLGNELTLIRTAGGQAIQLRYDTEQRLQKIVFPDGTVSEFSQRK